MTTPVEQHAATDVSQNIFVVGESADDRAKRKRKRELRDTNLRVWDGQAGKSLIPLILIKMYSNSRHRLTRA